VYNEQLIYDSTHKQIKPRFLVETITLKSDTPEAVDQMREQLSERVRKGDLYGFLEIGQRVADFPPDNAANVENPPDDLALRYQSNRITQIVFKNWAIAAINQLIQALRGEKAHVSPQKIQEIVQPVPQKSRGLSRRNAAGQLEDTTQQSLLASLFVPAGMMMLMFMVVMMVANPMLQGVIEEKMQRIAEVLLGSVQPFELMMGKLLGMTAVSLTISAVYLTGGYWAASHYGFGEYLPVELLVWFVLFQSLAGLLFGSLFIAIGAACTDMKEAQNLLLPVMLLVCLPLFVLGSVIKEPNSGLVTGLSFFPFATPMLMIARQSAPPGIPLWQPLVGIVGVLAMTVLCVWAAGRIFRVGLLMQGKGADMGQMLRWVFKG
jgi:ABC-2 type transport system permease protein